MRCGLWVVWTQRSPPPTHGRLRSRPNSTGWPAPGTLTDLFLWREERLVVETDGYAAHRGRQAFEDDHARELALHADGYRLRRFTDRQVRRQPDAVAAVVAHASNSDRAPENARARNV